MSSFPAFLNTLKSSNSIFKDESGQWKESDSPKVGETVALRVTKTFDQIWLYYANIIDYARIVMSVIALYFILQNSEYQYLIAFLIIGSVLLDWVDGPVARYFGQSTIFGSGIDWGADILSQYTLAIWSVKLNAPLTTFTVLFTCVEIVLGIFDFAISASTVYPNMSKTSHLPWYFKAADIVVPEGSYGKIGCIAWLANSLLPTALCLDMNIYVSYLLFPFAFVYAWHECVQLLFILTNWKEMNSYKNKENK